MNKIIFRQFVNDRFTRFEVLGDVDGVFRSPRKCVNKHPLDLSTGAVDRDGWLVFVNDIVTLGDDEQFVVTGCAGGWIYFTNKVTGEPFVISELIAHRMKIVGDTYQDNGNLK